MDNRGIYKFEKRAKQLLKFDGDRYGQITPTDIDAIIDYHGNTWVIHEVKCKGTQVPRGQIILFENFIKMAKESNRHAIAIISDHEIHNPEQPIYLTKDLFVRQFLSTETINEKANNMGWRPPIKPMKAIDMENQYISLFG